MQTRGLKAGTHRLRQITRSVWQCAGDFVYPPSCAICRSVLCDDAGARLCSACRADVAPVLPHRCSRCSAPVGPHLGTERGCIHCREDRFAFAGAISLGPYEGGLRRACIAAKAPDGAIVAAALAELLVEREAASLRGAPVDVIVPVPHHWTERLLRAHLPPVTLAAWLSRLLRVPWSRHILKKVRRTRPQVELSPTARRANLRHAFRLEGRPRLKGARVLLVDDVLTTGTTAHRAAVELKKAGAVVRVAVLARGLGPGAGLTATVARQTAPPATPAADAEQNGP